MENQHMTMLSNVWTHLTTMHPVDAEGIYAVASRKALMDKWKSGTHGGTYGGGNAVVLAAAIETIKVIQEENLAENARIVGGYLTSKLRDLQAQFPMIGDVRGIGMMVATEFTHEGNPDPHMAKSVAKACIDNRLLLLTCGTYGNVIRWIPPLITTKEQVDSALTVFEDALKAVTLVAGD